MRVRVESSTSILPSQGDDIMVEDVERETLSAVLIEVRLEEIISPLEEIPSMVKLDTPQLRKVVPRILRAENIVEGGCREDGSCANGTSDEPVVLVSDEVQDGRIESGHEVARKQGRRGCGVLFVFRVEDWVNIYLPCGNTAPTPEPHRGRIFHHTTNDGRSIVPDRTVRNINVGVRSTRITIPCTFRAGISETAPSCSATQA